MALIRARQNIRVPLIGRFGLPVIINTELPADPDAVVVEFGTLIENIEMPDYGVFTYSTSNGTFTSGVEGWMWESYYNRRVEGIQDVRAILTFLPVFKNRPVFKQPVEVKSFRTSNTNILASDHEVEI